MASSSDTIILYHYTDIESARSIIDHKYIKKSEAGSDAIFGDGVYLTELGPTWPKSKIARNNYDDATRGWEKKIESGKIEAAIEIKIERSIVKKCDSKRNIYLYPGDLYLSVVKEWSLIERED